MTNYVYDAATNVIGTVRRTNGITCRSAESTVPHRPRPHSCQRMTIR